MANDNDLLETMKSRLKPSIPLLVCSKLFMCALPIAYITIGVVYLNDCPRQPYIPIYLLVSGVFGLALAFLSCWPCDFSFSVICILWNSLVLFFLSCWFIAGNVWIYSIYPPNYNQTQTDYCNKTLYLFAFWTTTLSYIITGLLCVLSVCCTCLFMK